MSHYKTGPDKDMNQEILEHLTFLYGTETAVQLLPKLAGLVEAVRPQLPTQTASDRAFTERDTVLITYGDQVQTPGEAPLQTLANFCAKKLNGRIQTIHLLPFYPYSSDDGFSVIDYQAVDPALGSWDEVAAFHDNFQLMFDAVINHISAQSGWFHGYLQGNPAYDDFFVAVDPEADLTAVFRPRALPLLTPFETASGTRHLWTTFSDDQIDLNYANPAVLLAVLETLLFYVAQGATYVRLDAIGFMWKEIGTRCLNLPQTHRIIQLMRSVLDEVAPQVMLITETNIPHQENISYFGNGRNEAQMVYNFSLPPLLLHTFHTGNAQQLSDWASSLELPSQRVTFFNFCASHDGIGVTPARGILSNDEIEAMAERVRALGGLVSYKANGDGTQAAYELNINYLNALGVPGADESDERIARRFLASQAIMLALRGVPGIYFHSLFGSQNWHEGVQQTGRNRTINRQKFQRDALEEALQSGLRQHIFAGYSHLLRLRTTEKAFHPVGAQKILDLHPAVFAVLRSYEKEALLCLHNVSAQAITLNLPLTGRDLVTGTAVPAQLTLAPYQIVWIKPS
ncbi:MAG: alpha-glucosidase C-terminal domain-containing protein [Ardenticatenaceae bacterium]|nr:alpha-glucosidase C-terminal domain-containing protein [Anaerolineales bacterium]MCB8940874.1 alpha-glucosidase C-terminal domain-containing protein [Ardenticatenaceae bacterium]MCB8972213.1 alpha-glucosidase C-terminal domain-containing protein [Ardenticatenaceae bacterium]